MAGEDESMTVGSLLAPLYFGLIFAIAFEGILLSQWYVYWRAYYSKDPLYFSLSVHALCILELFHSAMIIHAGYWYFIRLWGESDNIGGASWSIVVELALTVLVSFVGRSFWIGWLIRLSRNWWLIGITGSLALVQLGLGILEVYEAIRAPFFSTLLDNKGAVIAQMVASDFGDIIISISLCRYLHGNRTGHRRTELVLDRLMRFIVTRGLLAAFMGAAQLISFVIWPTTFIFGIFHLMFSKIYTNALLATLNGRDYISGPLTGSSPSEATGTSLAITSILPTSSTGFRVQIPPGESIEMIDKFTSPEHSSNSGNYTTSDIHSRHYMDAVDPIYKPRPGDL